MVGHVSTPPVVRRKHTPCTCMRGGQARRETRKREADRLVSSVLLKFYSNPHTLAHAAHTLSRRGAPCERGRQCEINWSRSSTICWKWLSESVCEGTRLWENVRGREYATGSRYLLTRDLMAERKGKMFFSMNHVGLMHTPKTIYVCVFVCPNSGPEFIENKASVL